MWIGDILGQGIVTSLIEKNVYCIQFNEIVFHSIPLMEKVGVNVD